MDGKVDKEEKSLRFFLTETLDICSFSRQGSVVVIWCYLNRESCGTLVGLVLTFGFWGWQR